MVFASPLSWMWVLLPLLAGFLALVLVLRGLWHFGSGRFRHGSLHMATGIPLAALGAVIGLLVLNTQTFARLSYERPVVEVDVAALDQTATRYRVTVHRLDGTAIDTDCEMKGDELLSARLQKWKPWANVIGLDVTYALDQIANKYSDGLRGNGQSIMACDLKGAAPEVNDLVPNRFLRWLMAQSYVEQRRFGSAVFMPLVDGAMYRVTMTQSGLNAEAVNPIAQAAVQKGV